MTTTEGQVQLRGQNCRCGACGLLFRAVSTFDAHRHGPMTDRRCHASTYLVEMGWTQDQRGFWRRPGRQVSLRGYDPETGVGAAYES